MARKGENIYKRKDGRWEGRYIVSYDKSGKAKYNSVYASSYSDVKIKLSSVKQTEIISYKTRCKKVLNDYADDWLESIKINSKESTYAKYYSVYYKHIFPMFSNYKPELITTEETVDFLRKKLQSGLSPKTVKGIKTVMKLLLNTTTNNNCNFSDIIIKQNWREMRVFTIDEQKRLCGFLKTDMDSCKLGVFLCLYTGLRIGEICALKWKNIKFDEKLLKVEATIQRIKTETENGAKTKVVIMSPKSKTSCRKIPLTDNILDILKDYQKNDDAYVLTGKNTFIEPRTMQNRFKSYLKLSGIANANFHCTRHTFATRSIEAGMDVKTLSEILGHANINVTLSRYVHSSMDWKRKNMEKLTEFF